MRFETLPKKQQLLNSKSNREGRSTHTVIIPYKSQQVNFKNSLQISNLKKIAVFGARGKNHWHLGTQVLPQEDEGVANHAERLYSKLLSN
jgi:hypothetical protein